MGDDAVSGCCRSGAGAGALVARLRLSRSKESHTGAWALVLAGRAREKRRGGEQIPEQERRWRRQAKEGFLKAFFSTTTA